MKRFTPYAALVVLAAVPAAAQQLVAWPAPVSPNFWSRPFLPAPIVRPGPRPAPLPALPPDAAPVVMSGFRVDGVVTDRAAELTYRITFQNPTDRRLEGMLMIPLPADAALSGFTMTVGGKETKGELLESGQAASIYEGIVRQMRDPGLLEMVGERMFRARVFPIEPHGEIAATLKLEQALSETGGLASLRVPLRAAKSGTSAGRASARIEFRTSRPLRALFASTPDARIERRGDREAVATYEEGASGPQDLALNFSLDQNPLAAGVLAYRESDEDGTFMLTLSPKAPSADAPSAPKDVVFVLDRSGSMADDGKMDQAKKALRYCVSRLGGNDRFGIVDFATDWNEFEDRLVEASAENKDRARRYIDGLDASGGTNIEAALDRGLKLLSSRDGRVPMIFFLTDGVPTVGETSVDALLSRVAAANSSVHARLFDFGVGSDVNTLLLDKLADDGRGARDYVAPGEDIEAKLSALYQKVARPALTDLRVEWKGLDAAEVYPRPIPDLFHGSPLTLYGRYKSAGKGTLVVTGKSGGREVRFEYPVELPGTATANSFLPRLWAGQKIAKELDAIRLSGRPADAESVASIVKLAKKYGVVTPFTSFLVTEDGADGRALQEQGRRRFEALSSNAVNSGFSGGAVMAKSAQRDSLSLKGLSGGFGGAVASARGAAYDAPAAAPAMALSAAEADAKDELKKEGRVVVATKTVGDKTFYRRGGDWIDADAEGDAARGAARTTVKAFGPQYFELLSRKPDLARWFALGPRVTVLFEGTLYQSVSAD